MKVLVDVEKKTLRIFENERSIFRGEYGADKLELYINKQLINEYPTITALLSNGRKIGPYSTDEAYTTEIIDNVTYTKANFTLSKANGFTLSEGKMMITIWMNSNGKKEALGNVTLNVINTTAFDDGDIIISGDVEGTIVNIKVELENLQSQVNTFNGRITNLEAKKFIDLGVIEESPENAENTILNAINKAGVYTFTYDNNQYLMLVREISTTEYKQLIIYEGLSNNIKYILRYPYYDTFRIEKYETANKEFVDEYISSFNNSLYDLEVMIQEHENKVQNIADLGTIEESPTLKNNTILNGVTSGVYTFSYADEQYLMIASMRSLGSKQTILVNNDGVLKYIYRYKRTPRAWTVSEKELTTNDYVDKKIADLINGAPETLDTLFEIANALQDDDNAINGLITEISKKANKSDIPTKVSQLEQDVELGVSEEQVMEIIEENSEQVGEYNIGTSDSYDVDSDNEIPTSKAVKKMIGSGGKVKVKEFILNKDNPIIVLDMNEVDLFYSLRLEIYESEQSNNVIYYLDVIPYFTQDTIAIKTFVNNYEREPGYIFEWVTLAYLHGGYTENEIMLADNEYIHLPQTFKVKVYYKPSSEETTYFFVEI